MSGPTQTISTAERALLYLMALCCVVFAGILALVVNPVNGDFGRPALILGVLAIALTFIAAEAYPLAIEFRGQTSRFTLVTVPVTLGVVFLGPLPTMAAQVVGALVMLGLIRHQRGVKLVVNLAAVVLEVWVIAFLISFVSQATLDLADPQAWVAVASGSLAGELVTACIVLAAIRISVGPFEDGALASFVLGNALNSMIAVPLAVLTVVVFSIDIRITVLLVPFVLLLAMTNRQRHVLSERFLGTKRLYGFISDLSKTSSTESVIHRVLEQGVKVAGARRATLLVVGASGVTMWRQEDDMLVGEDVQPLAAAALLHTAEHGALFNADDVIDLSIRPLFAEGFEQALVGPFSGGQLRGAVILLDRVESQPLFDRSDIELAVAVAGHVGTTLGSAHLFDVVQSEMVRRERLALQDQPTGLRNRNGLLEDLPVLHRGAVFAVGVDQMRAFGTSFGHEVSEAVAVWVGQQLEAFADETTSVVRISTAQFAVVVNGACDPAEANAWARRLVVAASGPVETGGLEINVAVRVGVAMAPQHGTEVGELLRASDLALTEAFSNDRMTGWFEFERDRETTRRLELASELRDAIENDHLRLAYQPKVDLASGKVVGVEALARWPHAQRGFISPLEFIDIAERTGLIIPLTLWATRTACAQLAEWRAEGIDISMAINLSNAALKGSDLPWEIVSIVEEYHLPPESVIMEITESQLLDEIDGQSGAMSVFNAAGVQLSVDDFGTGYSSLAHMKRLEVQELKIDRAFVTNMGRDAVDRSLCSAMISMAHELGLRVVAEGIEDDSALDLLRELKSDIGQGYFFERPLPASEIPRGIAELEATLAGTVTRLQPRGQSGS